MPTGLRQKEHYCLWVLSTWSWWICLCFALTVQTAQHLSDEMGSIWAYLCSRWTTLSQFKMPRPDGVLFSPALLFFPSTLLQTNQYPHSLAFHRKDYREMAIKGLAAITSPISKPLKNSGSLGLESRSGAPSDCGSSDGGRGSHWLQGCTSYCVRTINFSLKNFDGT